MFTIKIKKHGVLRNCLLDIPFTYDEMMKALEAQKLSFPKSKCAELFPAPSMSKSFALYVLDNGKLPTQKEFCDYFMESHKAEIENIIDTRYKSWPKEEILDGLFARAARAYPSLVRDLHFSMFLKGEGWDVFWNPTVDVDLKTDVVVQKDGQLFGVALYTNTKRGINCRVRKLGETEMPEEFTRVELPINLSEGMDVGPFKLYGPKQAKQLDELISASA